jgi:hypothetical protein
MLMPGGYRAPSDRAQPWRLTLTGRRVRHPGPVRPRAGLGRVPAHIQDPRDRASTSLGSTSLATNDTAGIWSFVPEPSAALTLPIGAVWLVGLASMKGSA